jgi:hypothetical protein
MKYHHLKSIFMFLLLVSLFIFTGSNMAYAGSDKANYKVTIENLTDSQPFSPPVAATHNRKINMFEIRGLSSPELEAIAEDGDQSMMFNRLDMSEDATQAVDVGAPIAPNGTSPMGFSDATTFDIMAKSSDRFSLATMLICTNDGFTGLDRVRLPNGGAEVFWLNGYDAGTEMNTEESKDIVDPCSGLGPVVLDGDLNGNNNVGIETSNLIKLHAGVSGVSGDLLPAHDWGNPVAKVTVTRTDDDARKFMARLSGDLEIPPAKSGASGHAKFKLNRKETELDFELRVFDIEEVTQAHIHAGLPNENGLVVTFLFGFVDPPTGPIDGKLAKGTIKEGDLQGPFVGDFAGFVKALRNGELYVNVHTIDLPSGEVRGQIGAGRTRDDKDDDEDDDDDDD